MPRPHTPTVSLTKTATLLAALVVVCLPNSLHAQQSTAAAPPTFAKRFHQVPGGQFYVPAGVPVQLGISLAAPDASTQTAAVGSSESSVVLKEGPNTLQFGDTRVPVIADGTPPHTALEVDEVTDVEVSGVRIFGPNPKLKLGASDALSGVAQTLISIDGAPFVSLPKYGPVISSEGAHSLRYFSVDQVGNVEKLQEYKFRVDATAPMTALSITGPHTDEMASVAAKIVLTAKDNDSGVQTVLYKLDTNPEQIYSKPIVLLDVAGGLHHLQYYAVDAVNNKEAVKSYSFTVDRQPPAIHVTVDGPQFTDKGVRYVSPQSTLEITSQDTEAGAEAVRYGIDSATTLKTYSAPFHLPQQSGIRRLKIESNGPVENRADVTVSDIYMDLTPPETEVQFSRPSFIRDGEVVLNPASKIELDTSDFESGVASITYSIDGGAMQKYSAPFSVAALGQHELSVTAVDHVGNTEPTKQFHLRVEPAGNGPAMQPTLDAKRWYQDPKLGLIGPPGLPFDLRISDSAKDSGDTFVFVAGPADDKAPPLAFTSAGKKTLRVDVLPKPSEYGVLIDGLAPKTALTATGAPRVDVRGTTYFGAGLKLSLASTDDLSGVWKTLYSLDGSSFATYSKPLIAFSREGSYSLRYYALDNVGNTEDTHTFEFSVDTSAPQTRMDLLGPHNAGTVAQSTHVALTATDNLSGVAQLQYQLDNDKPRPYTEPLLMSSISIGSHRLRYYAVDVVGNREEEHTWRFNVEGPVGAPSYAVAGTSVERGGTLYMAPGSLLQLKAPEGDTVVYSLDGAATIPYSMPIASPETGTHKISFHAVDELGSVGTTVTLNMVTDRTPPSSHVRFEGPQIARSNGTIISGNTRIVIDANAGVFGAASLEYNLNGGRWQPYTGAFTLKNNGTYDLAYRAQNALSTIQTMQKTRIIVYAHGPNVTLSYSGPVDNAGDTALLPPGTLLFVSVEDVSIGLQKITYKLDDQPELIYRTPLSGFTPGKTHTITVVAEDLLGNRTVKVVHVRMKEQTK